MSRYSKLPVALVQERNHGDAEANLAVIETRVTEAAKSGAKLVLLQELHNGDLHLVGQGVDGGIVVVQAP